MHKASRLAFLAAPTFALALPAIAQTGAVPAPDLKPGDTWVYDRTIERSNNSFTDSRVVLKIERTGVDTMVVGLKIEGSPLDFQDHISGLDWSQRRIVDGAETATGRPFSFPMTVGETWTSSFVDPTHQGLRLSAEHHTTHKVVGWEDVTTPAGTFHALRIEAEDKVKAEFSAATGAVGGTLTTRDGATIIAHSDRSGPRTVYYENFATIYYAPAVKYWEKMVEETYNSENVRTERRSDTLMSFKPAA